MAAALGALALAAGWSLADGRDVADRQAATDASFTSTVDPAAPLTTTAGTTTSTVDSAPASTTTATTSTSTTTPSASTTSTSATTSTTAATDPEGRAVSITARIGECRFGTECLIAGFTLVGFPSEGTYVCEFDDGSRFEFRYLGDGADVACATSGDAITIEVDGVRSATATRESTG